MEKAMCFGRGARVLVGFVFVLAAVSLAAAGDDPAAGHEVFGTIVGSDGGPLAGVLVALSGGDVKQKVVSDAEGTFHFAEVPAGSYSMVFNKKGAKKIKKEITVSSEDLDLGTIAMNE